MNQGKALHELQLIDLAIIQRKRRLQEIAAQLADNKAVQQAQTSVGAAEAHLKPITTSLHDLELQVQSTRAKRDTTEKRLYSGSVSNPKELQDMQNEMASLTKWLAELEDRMLEVMVEVEDGEIALDETRTTLQQITDTVASANQDLLFEKQTLEKEVNRYQAERVSAENKVDPANLALYETLRPQKGNQPIAVLNKDDTCSACGIRQMGIVTKEIRRGDEIIYCKNCKRILVAI